MIRVQDLTYAPQPGLAILAGVTLTIARGEWVWLRGARHAGKSVFLRIIAALLRPTQGEVWWDDVSLQRLPARALPYWRRRVGMLFAEWPLIADQPVIESVALPLIVQGTPRRRAHARVRQWFDELGLAEQAELFPHELSGSERQLALWVRAVLHAPILLLLDEPIAGACTETAMRLWRLIAAAHAAGATVLVATGGDVPFLHEQPVRRVTLVRGRVVEDVHP